jgi:TetR/AcrR family transcriptional repressor of nem operon
VNAQKIGDDARRQALRQAMMLFWSKGLAQASYDDLVAATGLSRKALYAIWPDKSALAREAVALYRDEVLTPLLANFEIGGAEGLEAFWKALAKSVKGDGWSGCLLFRTASGNMGDDPDVVAKLKAHVEMLRAGFERAIGAAADAGELTRPVDPKAAAWQAVAIAGLISTHATQTRLGGSLALLVKAGREACGLPVGARGR